MKKTYQGSCHCGAVRFEADIDLGTGTGKCNCSICTKTRNWSVRVNPDNFRLLSGEADLSDYQFGEKSTHHFFCKHCGVHTFIRADIEEIGGHFATVRLNTLDNIDPAELGEAPVRYANGRDDNWWVAPNETRHL